MTISQEFVWPWPWHSNSQNYLRVKMWANTDSLFRFETIMSPTLQRPLNVKFLETNYSDNFLWIASIVTSCYEHNIMNLVSFVPDRNFLKSGSWHSKPQIFNTNKNCDSEYVVTLKCCVILVWHLQHFHIFSWQVVDIRRSILVNTVKKKQENQSPKIFSGCNHML